MQLALDTNTTSWSQYQEAVFAQMRSDDHLVVEALAGSGKTTTVIEAASRIPARKRVLICAFNTVIANELTTRVSSRGLRNIDVMTLHSLGFRALIARWGKCHPSKTAARQQLESVIPPRWNQHVSTLLDIVSWCKNTLTTTPEAIQRVGSASDMRPQFEISLSDNLAVTTVLSAMRLACRKSHEISFDDMVFVPAVMSFRPQQYDVVFVDETQDMNASQLKLAQSALSATGRLILVGDRNQAIYGWRGADIGAMSRMTGELNATVLPLSISYRCPKSVARLTRRVVPAFEVPDSAPEGRVLRSSIDAASAMWIPGDAVLSRKNAPLISLAIETLKRGVPARIQGRDIGAGLIALIQRFDCVSTASLIEAVRSWRNSELAALTLDQDDLAQKIIDQSDVIISLCEGLQRTADVRTRIESLFADTGTAVVFSSVHRAKGLEWDRVFLVASTFRPRDSEEEKNLWYVAMTRTKRDLIFATDPTVADAEVIYAVSTAERT